MRNQKGFTLIELIIVIVVLGILAVTAAPQFIDFSSDARASAVKGVKGALQGASQTIYSKAAIDGKLGADDEVLGIGTAYGYPEAGDTESTPSGEPEIAEAADLSITELTDGDETTDFVYIVDGTTVYIGPAGYIGVAGRSAAVSDFTAANGTSGEGCYASYTTATSTNGVVTPPAITSDTDGC